MDHKLRYEIERWAEIKAYQDAFKVGLQRRGDYEQIRAFDDWICNRKTKWIKFAYKKRKEKDNATQSHA